ncbi:MAG: sugar phosphate isomerase/epimerase family protein [Phycisphaeraceae bacterium]
MSQLNERIGVCSWSLHPANAVELVDHVAACGIDRVQLALNPLIGQPETWSDVGERCAAAGIVLRSGMIGCADEDYSSLESIRQTGGLVPDATWQRNQQIFRDTLTAARRLNIDCISTHAGFIPQERHDPASFGRIVERLRWAAELFAAEGATLLLETGQETAEALSAFLDAVDRPNVGVNFDPANMVLYDKGDPVASLERLMPRVGQVHVKDAVRTTKPGAWGAETPTGEGDVDFPALLAVLEDADFAGDLVIEREGGDERVANVRDAKQRIEQWLAAKAR